MGCPYNESDTCFFCVECDEEPLGIIQSIDVVGNTVEVTVELPGADEITVIVRDANNKRWSKHGIVPSGFRM